MSKVTDKNKQIKDWYVSKFEDFENKLNGQSETFLHDLRKDALEKVKELDFPHRKVEEWKYTNVSPILKHNFEPAIKSGRQEVTKDELNKHLFTGFDYHLLVFVNGMFSEELSDIGDLEKGVVVGGLSKVMKDNPELVEKYITKYSSIDNIFNALNLAYSYDGAFVYVPDGKAIEKPVQVLYLNGDDENNLLITPRNLFIAGKNAEAKIITNYGKLSENPYFTNGLTELYLDKDSYLDFYKIQNESNQAYHIEKVDAHQEGKSHYTNYSLSFGGGLVRNDINTKLDDEWSTANYYGLYLGNEKQHIDHHTLIRHAKANCESNEIYKGILDDSARGVFNGKIYVDYDAQKTNAYQTNKGVLLSDKARMDTKPQLEIYADDVICSHGATVGHLDDKSYFYIRSRGVPAALAKSILIRAFASDVVDKVKIESLRESLNHLIFEHLHRVKI